MIATLEGTDLAVVAVVVVVVAFLVYRLMRRSPLTRHMRVGIFVERELFDDAAEKSESVLSSEQITERKEWPRD